MIGSGCLFQLVALLAMAIGGYRYGPAFGLSRLHGGLLGIGIFVVLYLCYLLVLALIGHRPKKVDASTDNSDHPV